MRFAAAVVAVGLLAAACSSGGGKSGSSGKADPAADQQAAAAINIKASDFPPGWDSSPHKDTAGVDAQLAALYTCLGIDDPAKNQSAQANSDDFSQGGRTTVSSQVRFTKSAPDADRDFKAFSGSKAPGCIQQTFQQAVTALLPANAAATTGGFKIDKRAVAKTDKVNAVGYRATFTITIAGQDIPVTADAIYVQKGRAEGTVTFVAPVTPVPDDVQTQVVTAFEKRM